MMFNIDDRIIVMRDIKLIHTKINVGSVGRVKKKLFTDKLDSYYYVKMDNGQTIYGINGKSLMEV